MGLIWFFFKKNKCKGSVNVKNYVKIALAN